MPVITLDELRKKYASEKAEILKDYFQFLRFQSIATDPAFKTEVSACADWLMSYLQKIGLKVEMWPTQGAPTLFATHKHTDKKASTLLIYCHYDVQPVDPLNLWTTPPFEPTIREGNVFARGAVDDKGQCFYTIAALKALLEHNKLNCNLKFLIEGEEESGSRGLFGLLKQKKAELKADHVLIVDSGLQQAGKPAITLGVRGICTMSVTLKGSHFDLHSGVHGGIVYNPNRALCELLASLHDDNGRVTIPGFYDAVKPLSPQEKEELNFSFDLKQLQTHFGAAAIGMERGFTPLEAAWLRPTIEYNGISGGYAGAGFKTVIPALATAKVSCRLVPGQDPETIAQLVKKYLITKTPNGIAIDVTILPGGGKCVRSSPHSKIAQVMAQAYTEVFGQPCAKILTGGSIPIAADLAETSGGEILFVGVYLPEDQIHAPNEHFSLDRFEQGYLTIYRGLELLGND